MKHLKLFESFAGKVSENLQYHIDNNKPIVENVFRPGSNKYFDLLKEARQLYDNKQIVLSELDTELFESSDMGRFDEYKGVAVPLDLPLENTEEINEADYQGSDVTLNKPMRGGAKKYHVYVKDPTSGNVKKISFGDVHGGLTSKVSDPKARKSFAARHKCDTKKDKTTAGYWACRTNKFGHLWGGKTYPGYW